MTRNYLLANDMNTEIVSVVTKSAFAIVSGLRVRVRTDSIGAAEHIRNIGISLVKHTNMNVQVSRTISTCSLHLYNVHRVDSQLPDSTDSGACCKCYANINLQFCNALLYGTANSGISRLLNAAERLITRQAHSERVTAILRQLHLLVLYSNE